MSYMDVLVWAILVGVFVAVELATVQWVSIWFVLGAICAMVAAYFTNSTIIQILIFLVVSLIAVVTLRPVAKRRLLPQTSATNADRVIGAHGVVQEEISNLAGKGIVKVLGAEWTARSSEEEIVIAQGESVVILRIEGVKLIVEKLEGEQS